MHFTDGRFRLASLATAAIILVAACSSSGASSSPAASAAAPSAAPSAAAASQAPSAAASTAPIAGGLLAKVLAAKKLVVSTDPNYAPQSFLKPDGTFEGFDIDVATEIAKRLGVEVEFETPGWDIITAGSWAGRWDISVGSMTITDPAPGRPRLQPAVLLHAGPDGRDDASGITTLDGLAGKTVCVGVGDDLSGLARGQAPERVARSGATPPAGVKVQTLETDQDCAQAIAAGRKDAEGLLSVEHDRRPGDRERDADRQGRRPGLRRATRRRRSTRAARRRPTSCRARQDHQRHARRWHADDAVREVVRRPT